MTTQRYQILVPVTCKYYPLRKKDMCKCHEVKDNDREAWHATVHGVSKSQMTEWLNNNDWPLEIIVDYLNGP